MNVPVHAVGDAEQSENPERTVQRPRVAVVTGGSSGLGHELKVRLLMSHEFVVDWSLETGVDVTNENNVEDAARILANKHGRIDTLVNCAGINHIAYIPDLREQNWHEVMNTNAKAIWLTAKHLVHLLVGGTICNIVSNASHMPMTASIAYNASKGAAEIMTKQMARELIKTHAITVFGVSPNKLSGTKMSEYIDKQVATSRGWTMEQTRDYQRKSLQAGDETDPATLAEFIAFLLSKPQRHRYLTGCILQYGL